MDTTRIVALLILSGWLSTAAIAQDPPDRVDALETRVARMAKELAEMRVELRAAKQGAATSEARVKELESKADSEAEDEMASLIQQEVDSTLRRRTRQQMGQSPILWSGYFDLEFRDDKAGSKANEFDQHRLVLRLHSDVTNEIAFDMELELEGGGVGSSRLTDSEIVIEFAELSFSIAEEFNLKAGALLVPFNRFNLLHDSPVQDLTDRPLVDRRIVPTTWSEAGIGAFGAFYWNWGSLDYDVILVNGLTDAISASGGTRGARGSYRADNNDNKMVIGRIGLTLDVPFFDVVTLGGSLAHGKYDDGNQHNLTMYGFDVTLKKGPFEIVGEFARLNISRGDAERMAGIPGGMEGWYIEARYHFFFDSWRGASPFFNSQSTFTLVARYGEADTDDAATAVDFAARGDGYRDDRRRLTLGFNFRPVEGTVIKFEYQWFFEPSGIDDVDNNRIVASFATYF